MASEAAADSARVATVAMHSVMGDWRANLDRVEHWASKARADRATFAVFPEECITGSLNKSDLGLDESRRIAEEAASESVPRLEALCRRLSMTLVVGTIGRRLRPSTPPKCGRARPRPRSHRQYRSWPPPPRPA